MLEEKGQPLTVLMTHVLVVGVARERDERLVGSLPDHDHVRPTDGSV